MPLTHDSAEPRTSKVGGRTVGAVMSMAVRNIAETTRSA